MKKRFLLIVAIVFWCGLAWAKDLGITSLAGEEKSSEGTDGNMTDKVVDKSLTVTGDTVQYSPESKAFTASGNVQVEFKGAKLTCDSISVDTATQKAVAQGHARLDDSKGMIAGEKITYDFGNKSGVIEAARFRASPFFGNTELLEKISDTHFLARRTKMSTCTFDHPHYFFRCRSMNMYPDVKLTLKDSLFYVKGVPLAYLPVYNRQFGDPLVHVQVTPGSSKEWGKYALSAWQYQLSDNVNGKVYFDARSNLGLAEGFGTNVKTEGYGTGDFKFYYTREEPARMHEPPNQFVRYFARGRHKWDIDPNTNFLLEYYKINDEKRKLLGSTNNVLKDYFPREYEKDAQPLSYVSLHRSFTHSSIDLIVQKRTNNWYSQIEKLPEITYNMPSLQLGDSRLYLENISSFAALNQAQGVPAPENSDKSVDRLDIANKLSLPSRFGFINFTPFLGSKQTFYSRDLDENNLWAKPRTIFSTGADVSTKFYRVFKVKTNAFHLNINDLRHIITPSIAYGYQHRPTIPSSKLLFESIPGPSNSASLVLSNKLQTKRNNLKVDLADIRLSTPYGFRTGDGNKSPGAGMGDVLYEMDLIPYSWLRVHSDMTYVHSGSHDQDVNPNFGHVSGMNYDINFMFPHERSFSIGQRYQRKGENEVTTDLSYRLTPKWKILFLQRYLVSGARTKRGGLHEQQYTLIRDLHCWTSELTFSIDSEKGSGVYLVFRLKAFPEMQVDYNKSYNVPKPGAQVTP